MPDSRKLQLVLKRLHMPELQRSSRLKRDLARLVGLEKLETLLRKPAGERIRDFIDHIEQAVATKPHILLAYAWIMYMALFNGGRWMRTQLLAAGEDFWHRSDLEEGKDDPIQQSGLSFFHFGGDMDGEDIKEDFKKRLAEVEKLLTADEKSDIVAETSDIFYHCRMMIEELAALRSFTNAPLSPATLPTSQLLLKHVLPLGLAELTEGSLALLAKIWNYSTTVYPGR